MDIQQTAIRYLSYRERSAHEVRQFLKGKGFSSEEIAPAMVELEEMDYVNDDRYCESFIRYALSKGKASLRIKQELKEKGIEGQRVELFLEEMLDRESEKENALKEAEKILRKFSSLKQPGGCLDEDGQPFSDLPEKTEGLDEKLKGKIGRRLSALGYQANTIYSVLEKLK